MPIATTSLPFLGEFFNWIITNVYNLSICGIAAWITEVLQECQYGPQIASRQVSGEVSRLSGQGKRSRRWNPESAVDTMGPEVADGDRKKSGPSFASNGRIPGGARTSAISTRLHRRFQWRGQAGPVGGTIPHAEGRIVRN